MKKKKKPKLKSLSSLKKKAWTVFSQYIRLSNAERNENSLSYGVAVCYTCGERSHWKEMQAGHAIPGRHNAVLFDEDIVKVQCVACNIFKRGNYPIFTTKLIKAHGMEWWEKKLEGSRKTVKYTRFDIQEIIDKYQSKVESLG